MEIRIVDFDVLTRKFQLYVDGYLNIELEKKKFLEGIEPKKKEIESLLMSSASGIIINESTQRQNVERFGNLKNDLMRLDSEFKTKAKGMQEELNVLVFEQLSKIISDWGKENSIDLIMGKMEVVFNTDVVEITNDILEILKVKGLHVSKNVSSEVE